MDDVIFAGTAARPARDLPRSPCCCAGSAGRRPGFDDADELEISRRIERGAGSVFRVNGREVRASDVQLLFADAATGAPAPRWSARARSARDRRQAGRAAAAARGGGRYRRPPRPPARGRAEAAGRRGQSGPAGGSARRHSEQRRALRSRRARPSPLPQAQRRLPRAEAALLVGRWRLARAELAGAEQPCGRPRNGRERASGSGGHATTREPRWSWPAPRRPRPSSAPSRRG